MILLYIEKQCLFFWILIILWQLHNLKSSSNEHEIGEKQKGLSHWGSNIIYLIFQKDHHTPQPH